MTSTSPTSKLYTTYLLLAAVCLACLLFAYRTMGSGLYTAWQMDEYSHGIIIPFIALLIAWHRLVEARPPIRPSFWGIAVLGVSIAMLLVGDLAAFQTAAHYGFILALVGLTLAFWGIAAARVMAPAFVYLLFAIPLPHLLYSSLSQDLQLISSTLGVAILELLGISVFQEGNIIDLGSYKLQVVEACSGLRYLFPLFSFGYLVAYLLEDRLWKRALVLFSTIPITIGMNSLRIALIGVTVNIWGPSMAEGVLHDFEGWVVFLACTAILMAEVLFLLRLDGSGRFRFEVFAIHHGRIYSGTPQRKAPALAAVLVLGTLAVSFGTNLIGERPEIQPEHPAFATFPLKLQQWQGQENTLEADVLDGLQLSDYWMADYFNQDDQSRVNLYIAYYASQRVGSTTHSPSSCIPGGGWEIVDRAIKPITLDNGTTLDVSRFLIRRSGISQIVYFWFDERGRNITETHYAKWYLLVDSITMHRTDGALIRLVTPLSATETEANAEKRLQEFLSVSYPVIKKYVPGETVPSTDSSQ